MGKKPHSMTQKQWIKSSALMSSVRLYAGSDASDEDIIATATKFATFIRGENIENPDQQPEEPK